MSKIYLRKIIKSDITFFTKWWRDEELIRLTSGSQTPISEKEIKKYFQKILINSKDYNYIITLDNKTIGHISAKKRRGLWYETQIIIGEKENWGKGYGSTAIKLMISRLKRFKISKIYLEVRPENERAIKAYTKCGFTSKRKVYYPKNTDLSETLRMELVKK